MNPQCVRVVVSPSSFHQTHFTQTPVSLKTNVPAIRFSTPMPPIRLLSSTTQYSLPTTLARIILTPTYGTLNGATSVAAGKIDESNCQNNSFLSVRSSSSSTSSIAPLNALTSPCNKVKKQDAATKSTPKQRKKTHRRINIEHTGKNMRVQMRSTK